MKIFKAGLLGILFVSILAFVSCTPSLVPEGWELLAKRELSFATSRDAIELPMAAKPMKSLLIVPRMNDIEIFGLKITFENGEDYSPEVHLKMKANADSQAIDLPGAEKRIRRVELQYKKIVGSTRRAMIELWGK